MHWAQTGITKMNKTNIFYILVLLMLIVATGFELLTDKHWARYYYKTVVSAPDNYPVTLKDAYFILADSTKSTLNYNAINSWGESNASYPEGEDHLPVKLVLSYLSYRDKLFYADTIPLPAAALDSIFKNLDKTKDGNPVYNSSHRVNFSLNIVVGIANKGNIIVWLQGHNYEHTLLKHHIASDKRLSARYFPENGEQQQLYFNMLSDEKPKEALRTGKDANANYIDSPSLYSRTR